MLDLDRRSLLSFLGVALIEFAAGCSSLRRPVRSAASAWLVEIDGACAALRSGEISQSDWQSATEATLRDTDLSTLLAEVEFERIAAELRLPDLGVTTQRISRLESAFPDRCFIAKIFGVQRDRAIIPHGHKNMASAHLVLSGEFEIRQFDRISETADHMVIRQTVDEIAPVGSVSSISDEKNNVHWLRATSDRAYTLDLIVSNLADRPFEIHNIDPQAGRRINASDLTVPKLNVDEALRKYGKSNWELSV